MRSILDFFKAIWRTPLSLGIIIAGLLAFVATIVLALKGC